MPRRPLVTHPFMRQIAAFFLIGTAAVALVGCGGGDDGGGGDDLPWDAQSLQESASAAPFDPPLISTSVGVGPSSQLFALIERETRPPVSEACLVAPHYRLPTTPQAHRS